MTRTEALLGAALLAALTLAVHGLALFDGVVLDDFWHQKGLGEHGWSFSELLRTLDISPSDFIHAWWQTRHVSYQYLRPFFIVCMKFIYTVGGGDPMALHAFSILLHLTSALLVWRLCWLLTRHRTWSLVGAILFVIYPHSVVTVAWPSSQNVVLQTTLLLAALLCYLRASRLQVSIKKEFAAESDSGPPPLSRGRMTLTLLFWLVACFTRENALLLPAILAGCDLALGGRRHLWRRRAFYATCIALGVTIFAWRGALNIHPLPDVYCRRPANDHAEYAGWLVAKFLHYFCTSVWPAPMTIGPTGRYNPWSEVPGDCLLMLAIIGAVGLAYVVAARGARGYWLWPAWIALFVLPVLPVVATPHSGYMSGVGFATALAVAPAAAETRGRRWRARLGANLTLLSVFGAAFMTPVNRLQWTAIYSAERLVPRWVMLSPPAPPVRDVFFINLPFVNVYCKPNLTAALGPWFEDVNVHVLTYAPDGIQMNRRTIVRQLDDHSFTVEVEGRPYFSGLLGRFLLEGFRGKERFTSGQVIDGGHFRTVVLRADEQGVWQLRFDFPRPLEDPSYCFYLTTKYGGAARLRFGNVRKTAELNVPPVAKHSGDLDDAAGRLAGGHSAAALPLFATILSGDVERANVAAARLRPTLLYMLGVLGSPHQQLLDGGRELTVEDWRTMRDWWAATVDDRTLQETWVHRHDFDDLVWLRYEIEFDRFIAAHAVQSDLYLTGPPFPGPRGR